MMLGDNMTRVAKVLKAVIFALFAATALGCTSHQNDAQDNRIFYEQTAIPIYVIGGMERSFILMDDGSLWSFGWIDDGRYNGRDSFIYRQTPVFIMDEVVRIFESDWYIFANTHDGEELRLGRYRQGFELFLVDDEIWASGTFLRGHLRIDGFIYGDFDEPVKMWSNGVFLPNQQILRGFWYITETSVGHLMPLGAGEAFGYKFYENGIKRNFITHVSTGETGQYGRIVWLDDEHEWVIMEDGRLKIMDEQSYEIFEMHLFRNQSSAGMIDELRLHGDDFYKVLWRFIE
ncbi:MAG: hypothetical protein FWE44_06505 [Defluviitaleaceae bacterium]|nr:hypothetical protein [Defluviitaleaceae bacterium]